MQDVYFQGVIILCGNSTDVNGPTVKTTSRDRQNQQLIATMDSFLKAAGVLYFVAVALAVVSLALPEWVVSAEREDLRLGLLQHCQQIHGRPMQCNYRYPPDGPVSWIFAAILILLGVLALTIGMVMIALSDKMPQLRRYPKYLGLASWSLFCLAIVMFPAGFNLPLIGGESFLLPSSAKTGISYGLFFTGILCTVCGAVLALGRMYFAMIVWRGHT